MAFPPPPNEPGNTLSPLQDNDTFRTWFDRTNELINAINPLDIYGVTAMTNNPGITIDIDALGIANLGFSLPAYLTGGVEFGGHITFENNVEFLAGISGNIVNTFNGMTGDVTFDSAGLAGASTGKIVVYNTDGATWQAQDFFGGITQNVIVFGASGGMILGGVTHDFAGKTFAQGTIMLKGGSTASILFQNTQPTIHFLTRFQSGKIDKRLLMQREDRLDKIKLIW